MRQRHIRSTWKSIIAVAVAGTVSLQCANIAMADQTNESIQKIEQQVQDEFSPEELQEWHELSPEMKEDFAQYVGDDEANLERKIPTRKKRTANPNYVNNDGIGRLVLPSNGSCTASNIGWARWWITAAHCVEGATDQSGYIRQSDGNFAGIERIFIMDTLHDIALIRVGGGIRADEMYISDYRPVLGQRLTAIGFGGDNNKYMAESNASMSNVEIVATNTSTNRYTDMFRTKILDYPTIGGDSGGPVYDGNLIYGVLSAGSVTNDYYAFTGSYTGWMNDRKKHDGRTSLSDRFRAWKGGTLLQAGGVAKTILKPFSS